MTSKLDKIRNKKFHALHAWVQDNLIFDPSSRMTPAEISELVYGDSTRGDNITVGFVMREYDLQCIRLANSNAYPVRLRNPDEKPNLKPKHISDMTHRLIQTMPIYIEPVEMELKLLRSI